MIIMDDCRFFKGDKPCLPHKEEGVHCEECRHYSPVGKRILIIKLGAIGDVIRTTPLVRRLLTLYPDCEISWLTDYPEVVPPDVHRIYTFNAKDILSLISAHFEIVYNLDKDVEACSLTNILQADVKKGFYLKNGKCAPIDSDACHKWLTGLFDDVCRQNVKSYPEEIFEICGFKFDKEEYILHSSEACDFKKLKKKDFLIGLNTGCGSRWKTRLWPEDYWIETAKRLMSKKADVILLGGRDEDERNRRVASLSGCMYAGIFPVEKFISLVRECDVVVTGVTMALHIAIGLKKKVVLLNNIFNKNEFELYNSGMILEPDIGCLCCYKAACEKDCMSLIKPDAVINAVKDSMRVEMHG